MISFLVLPMALVALLLALPAFAAQTSAHDPFREIAIRALPKPSPPICCLKPVTPLDSVEDDVLLSFEEWKAKQFAMQAEAKAKAKEKDSANRSGYAQGSAGNGVTGGGNGSETIPTLSDVPASSNSGSIQNSQDSTASHVNEEVSPHFRVPLTDRFNYASLDCSARVHTAHRSAKSPSSILASKRDRYMLSPCNSAKQENQYVVVELCEDIRIDTVQLANFEFFSGVFKDFTVSVAKTYTTDAEGWTVAGTYKAKNIRGVQSFHPPTSLRDFYRYIRIDFHSHYSNEYYCPVSLLRVYGLTHLEQWKWDMWDAESRAKRDEMADARIETPSIPPVEVIPGTQSPQDDEHGTSPQESTVMSSGNTTEDMPVVLPNVSNGSTPTFASPPAEQQSSLQSEQASSSVRATGVSEASSTLNVGKSKSATSQPPAEMSTPPIVPPSRQGTPDSYTTATATPNAHDSNESSYDKPVHSTDTYLLSPPLHTGSLSVLPPNYAHLSKLRIPESGAIASTINSSRLSSSSSTGPNTATTTTTITASSTPVSIPLPLPVPPATTGGESIYRTIMNRLTALEANHTLYARYVEEQTSGVREMLRRLGEDVGRLDGIGKAQAQIYARTLQDWERQRKRLDLEYGELMHRVNYLADEIVLEKRLGIAQLCLLLAVLVFMGLTRGSRGESFMEHAPVRFNKSMREWGQRHLSFSSGWANRFRSRSRSRSPKPKPRPNPTRLSTEDDQRGDGKVEFPPLLTAAERPRNPNKLRVATTPSQKRTNTRGSASISRSRTPSLRSPVARHFIPTYHPRPGTPPGSSKSSAGTGGVGRPPIQRANSQGATPLQQSESWSSGDVIGPVPKSARRWARSAHLHEVRGVVGGGGVKVKKGGDGEGEGAGAGGSGVVKGEKQDQAVDVFVTPRRNGYRVDGPGSQGGLDFKGKKTEKEETPQVYEGEPVEGEGEADLWVDTDASADGSELDSDMNLDSGGNPEGQWPLSAHR